MLTFPEIKVMIVIEKIKLNILAVWINYIIEPISLDYSRQMDGPETENSLYLYKAEMLRPQQGWRDAAKHPQPFLKKIVKKITNICYIVQ